MIRDAIDTIVGGGSLSMDEAAQVMKAMELEEQDEQDLLDRITAEVAAARARALGPTAGDD